jgi:hypothetical protein
MIEKSHLPSQNYSNVSLVDQFVAALDDNDDRSLFDYTTGSMDQQYYSPHSDSTTTTLT